MHSGCKVKQIESEKCPQRIVTCDYCEFPFPAIDLLEHQEVCGDKAECCNLCSRYISLRGRHVHESRCNGGTNVVAESSSDRAIPSSNLDLHVAHCSRKLEKCKICGDVVPKKHAEEHFLSTHAPNEVQSKLSRYSLHNRGSSRRNIWSFAALPWR